MNPEIDALVEQLETILHESLPAAARSGDPIRIREAVHELDTVQGQLGLKTFELLRQAPLQPLHPSEAFDTRQTFYRPETRPLPAQAELDPGEKGEPVEIRCQYLNCQTTQVETCIECSKPFCARHVHPSAHPCGDLM